MPNNFTFDIDARGLEDDLVKDLERATPNVAKELLQIAKEVQREWADVVSGGTPLAGMTRKVNDAKYAQAILDPSAIEVSQDGLEVTIRPKEQERIALIEEGHPQFDMKPSLLARKSAKTVGGSRFVNVPIRTGSATKFRRVSTNTPVGKWVQKAVPPNPVVASVQRQAEAKVAMAVIRAVNKVL